ncbi:MAG: phage regulatory CII family protein [Comamonadaceae bacterium]|nr:phage regulatory CII family protein [Comamonadaceae bacterium]
MDVHDAAYRVAHDFLPDGAVGLARKLGKVPGTFLNQLNPHQETAKLGLGDAVAMSAAANDLRIAQAFADTLDCLLVRKPDLSRVSDASLLDMVLTRDVYLGAFAGVVRSAIDDGAIDPLEMARIEEAAHDLAAATLELVERLRGLRRG